MTKTNHLIALIFFAGFFCFAADAMEIIKYKENRYLVRLDGKQVAVGDRLDVVDDEGNKTGIVEITKFNETKVLAKIVPVELRRSGMRLTQRSVVTIKVITVAITHT